MDGHDVLLTSYIGGRTTLSLPWEKLGFIAVHIGRTRRPMLLVDWHGWLARPCGPRCHGACPTGPLVTIIEIGCGLGWLARVC